MRDAVETVMIVAGSLAAALFGIALLVLVLASPFIAIGWGLSVGAWLFCLPMSFC
jgi:hypothetical protein